MNENHDCDSPPDEPKKAKLLLVDTSYVVFAKYYSTLSWYKMSVNKNPEVSTLFDSSVFKNKFEDLFNMNINKLLDAHCDENTKVVFAKDCNRNLVWRRSHFTAYKESRTQNANFNSEAFSHTFGKIIPRRINRKGGVIIGTNGAEADDVIGVIHEYIRNTDTETPILIITNDNDCIQLVDDNTRVLNLVQQDVGARRGELTPRDFLRTRILSGDRSDNIPSIVPRCGPRTAAKLIAEYDAEQLKGLYGAENYDRNDLLMNMKNVPQDLKDEIITQYNTFLRIEEEIDNPELQLQCSSDVVEDEKETDVPSVPFIESSLQNIETDASD
ncbi:5'-3' exonuclease [Tetraselmis virus 1]|uniref:5'-3' exonuclease n=1 Tax=Tetraselmis virus 1 TaxID=2060617 RepID=A0A2P0VP24_9VIRU|nr:5'-3' exonuclease [Tetraselmis virus 1]AUF82657.1 5'-3' exonuclease [Tetraselmis virus 1]